jgi:hypothetical protein
MGYGRSTELEEINGVTIINDESTTPQELSKRELLTERVPTEPRWQMERSPPVTHHVVLSTVEHLRNERYPAD